MNCPICGRAMIAMFTQGRTWFSCETCHDFEAQCRAEQEAFEAQSERPAMTRDECIALQESLAFDELVDLNAFTRHARGDTQYLLLARAWLASRGARRVRSIHDRSIDGRTQHRGNNRNGGRRDGRGEETPQPLAQQRG